MFFRIRAENFGLLAVRVFLFYSEEWGGVSPLTLKPEAAQTKAPRDWQHRGLPINGKEITFVRPAWIAMVNKFLREAWLAVMEVRLHVGCWL